MSGEARVVVRDLTEIAGGGRDVERREHVGKDGREAVRAQAFDLLRKLKDAATPVLFVRAAGTAEARVVATTLGVADASVADMRTLVIVGASTTRQVGRWVYTPRSERRT